MENWFTAKTHENYQGGVSFWAYFIVARSDNFNFFGASPNRANQSGGDRASRAKPEWRNDSRLVAAKNLSGEWRYFEVKSTLSDLPTYLKGEQKDIVSFVRSRLERAADPEGQWKNVAPEVRARAQQLLDEINAGVSDIKGFKVDVYLPQEGGIGLLNGPVQMDFTPW